MSIISTELNFSIQQMRGPQKRTKTERQTHRKLKVEIFVQFR